jgi:DNA-binding beta-propeller fold protein YncE
VRLARALLAGAALAGLGRLRADPAGFVLVANQGDDSVTVADAETDRPVATLAEHAVRGHELVASPDGRYAFVPIYGNSGVGIPGIDGRTMLVFDLRSRSLVHTVDFGRGVRPHCIRYDPNSGDLFVTTELDRSVTIVDAKSWRIVGRVPTGQSQSHMLVLTRDGRRGYTANVGPGTVSVLDLVGRRTLGVIHVAEHVQRIAISNDDRWVFTSDTENPRLAVIDAAAQKLDGWIRLPGKGYGAVAAPEGDAVLVALPAKGKLALVNVAERRVARTLDLPGTPQEILLSPDGLTAYVSGFKSASVAVVDLPNWRLKTVIPAGKGADGLAWAPPPR